MRVSALCLAQADQAVGAGRSRMSRVQCAPRTSVRNAPVVATIRRPSAAGMKTSTESKGRCQCPVRALSHHFNTDLPATVCSGAPGFRFAIVFMTFALRNACALTGRHHSRVRQRACFKSAWRGFGASDWRCPAARGHAASLLTPVQRRLRIRFFRAAKPRGSKASSLLRLKLHPISN
jgi:hypothetical protein